MVSGRRRAGLARRAQAARRYVSTARTRRCESGSSSRPSLRKICLTCASTVRSVTNESLRRSRDWKPFGEQAEHLALAPGQLVERVVAAPAAERGAQTIVGSTTVSPSASRRSASTRMPGVEHALLEQVADALGMLLEQPQRVARLDVAARAGARRRRDVRADLAARRRGPRRCASAACGCRRSPRRGAWRPPGAAARRRPRPRRRLDAGLAQQAHDALAREHRVLGDDYAHGISARRSVGARSSPPPSAPTRSATWTSDVVARRAVVGGGDDETAVAHRGADADRRRPPRSGVADRLVDRHVGAGLDGRGEALVGHVAAADRRAARRRRASGAPTRGRLR